MMQLVNDVRNLKGCRIVNLQYYAEEKTPKYLGLGKVTKRVNVNVQVNFDYENAVNNRLEKLGLPRTFSASSLPWGTWDTFNKVISHKGEFYLRYYEMKNEKPQVQWYVDGRTMTDAEKAILLAYKAKQNTKSAKQSAEGLDDNQVKAKGVKFANIEMFKCGDIDYTKATKAVV